MPNRTVDGVAHHAMQADVETSSEDYARRFSGPVGKYLLEVQEQIVWSLLAPYRGARVLDVGGGHGQLAVPLVRRGYDVTVAGSHSGCRERLDQLLAPGSFHYEVCNLLELPFGEKRFEVVLCLRLLPHVPAWRKLIAELSRVAAEAVIVDYPDGRSINALYKIAFEAKRQLENHTREFNVFHRKDIKREFHRNGFGQMSFRPQFVLPMAGHRYLRKESLSRLTEKAASRCGLTRLFGSPIIARACRGVRPVVAHGQLPS